MWQVRALPRSLMSRGQLPHHPCRPAQSWSWPAPSPDVVAAVLADGLRAVTDR